MINYKEYKPSPSLSPFVECYWSLNSHSRHFAERELVVPGGRAELLFNYGDPFHWFHSDELPNDKAYSGALLLGQRNRFYFLNFTGVVNVFSVRFKAGGLAPFIDLPVNNITNEILPQKFVFGKQYDNWHEQLSEKSSDKVKVYFIEQVLLQLFKTPDDLYKQTFQSITAVKKGEIVSVDTMCRLSGAYYKKLERNYFKYVGYSPKAFSNIMRFYKSVTMLKSDMISLTDVGFDCGYYDQAHFIREFKKYSGFTPSALQLTDVQFQNYLLKGMFV